MTVFILLFSVGYVALVSVLLHVKKIQPVIFAALMALLVIFDFALISLDKIYYLHKDQDDFYVEQMRAYDKSIADQQSAFKRLTDIQLGITLKALSLNSKQENESSIQEKIKWRDQLKADMAMIGYEPEQLQNIDQQINQSIHQYLMEQLNSQIITTLGHRIYSEFVRSKPRDQWTDDLFVYELEIFLTKQKIMKPNLEFAISRVKVFKASGELLDKDSKHKESDLKSEEKKEA
jgi:hypothetical protein